MSTAVNQVDASGSSNTGRVWSPGAMWLASIILMEQIQAVQNYVSLGIIPTAAFIQTLAEQQANYWINLLSGSAGTSGFSGPLPTGNVPPPGVVFWPPIKSDGTIAPAGYFTDQQIVNWCLTVATANNQQSTYLQVATSALNAHNTQYSEDSSRASGMAQQANQNASSVQNQVQTCLQLIQSFLQLINTVTNTL